MPEIPAFPDTCNLKAGLESPIPTLPANSAIETVASAFALIKGTPEISLTENNFCDDIVIDYNTKQDLREIKINELVK